MRILDMGAGEDVYSKATDYVDALSKADLNWCAKRTGHTLPKKGYKYNVDYNKKIPYPAETFDEIYSSHSLGSFALKKAFLEMYRILKPNGKVTVHEGSKDCADKVIKGLKRCGFSNIMVGQVPRKPVVSPTGRIIHLRPIYEITAIKETG